MRRGLAAGNWKMNGTGASLVEIEALKAAHGAPAVDVLICPPATLVARLAAAAAGSAIATGGQDCHANASGAHTGDIAADMLVDAGASHVIVGHSERRADHGESDADVRAKAEAALAAGLVAVICLGESLEQREGGETLEVIGAQLAGSLPDGLTGASAVIAYEPIWAIGTGLAATPEDANRIVGLVRSTLADMYGAATADEVIIQYGGSMKPENVEELMSQPEIDGGLIGGAALNAPDFTNLVEVAARLKGAG